MGYSNIEIICVECNKLFSDALSCDDCGAFVCGADECIKTHDLDHAPDEPDEDQRAQVREL